MAALDALLRAAKRRARKHSTGKRVVAVAALTTLASLLKSHPGATIRAIASGGLAGGVESLEVATDRLRSLNPFAAESPTDPPDAVPSRKLLKALVKLRRQLGNLS